MKPMKSFRLYLPSRTPEERLKSSKFGTRLAGAMLAVGSVPVFLMATERLMVDAHDLWPWLSLYFGGALWLFGGFAGIRWGRMPIDKAKMHDQSSISDLNSD
jgi:hypothetical protein